MIPIIEDAILGSDLDGKFYSLLNVNALVPVPANLATSDDPRLTDVREPLPGSVTNASVAADAAIDQSKLNLNGQIPTAWLGTTATTAARGDLAEYIANKNVPGGYCGLDGAGKIPSSRLPDAVGLATVTSVGLSMPPEFVVTHSPVTGSDTLTANWISLTGPAWFGRISGTGVPAFQTGALPLSMVPNLDASQVNTGVFAVALLPPAVGVGGSHATGMVPDPGATGVATDYLGRDMLYHTAPTIAVGYQTQLPAPTLTVSPATGARKVTPSYDPAVATNEPYQDAVFFFSQTSPGNTGFEEFPEVGYANVLAGTVWVYASHPGYNNSPIVSQG